MRVTRMPKSTLLAGVLFSLLSCYNSRGHLHSLPKRTDYREHPRGQGPHPCGYVRRIGGRRGIQSNQLRDSA